MISTRHTEPSLLVWWVNPLDQPEPAVATQWRRITGDTDTVFGLPEATRIRVGEEENLKEFRKRWRSVTNPAELAAMFPRPSSSDPAAVSQLTPGINGLAAFDSVRTIWVRGTEEGQDNLQLIIEYLDRPRQRVDYQVQLIELPRSIPQTLTTGKPTKFLAQSLSSSIISGENRNKLTAFIASRRATVVQSKHVSTVDNILP
jgi:hypothetical protein